ncbi:hypothetical protein B7494_g5464 [Chlorociboria aeruginascens]|nr:hypothetical protein B7494_g5464 [Chlorociboria aeruginascens]
MSFLPSDDKMKSEATTQVSDVSKDSQIMDVAAIPTPQSSPQMAVISEPVSPMSTSTVAIFKAPGATTASASESTTTASDLSFIPKLPNAIESLKAALPKIPTIPNVPETFEHPGQLKPRSATSHEMSSPAPPQDPNVTKKMMMPERPHLEARSITAPVTSQRYAVAPTQWMNKNNRNAAANPGASLGWRN